MNRPVILRFVRPGALALGLACVALAIAPATAQARPSKPPAKKAFVSISSSPADPLDRPVTTAVNSRPVLSLAEAATLARNHSLGIELSQEHLVGLTLQRTLTVDSSWPQLGASIAANYNQLPSDSPLLALLTAPGGGGIVGFPAPGTTVDTTLHASQILFDGFRLRDSLTVADDQIAMGRISVTQTSEDAMTNAAVAYFGVLQAEGLADVATASVRQAQEHLRLGNERLKAGSGTQAEVLTQRAQLAASQGALIQQRNAVNTARLQLNEILNSPVGDRPLQSTAQVPELRIDVAHELAAGLPRRPEVQTQILKGRLDTARASLASRGYIPTLQATSSWAQRGLYQGEFGVGVTMDWNAFDGFKTRDQVAAAQSDADTDAISLEQTRQQLALEARTQVQARQEALDRISIAREGLGAADEAYRISIQRYQLGFSTSTELLDARTTLAQARNTFIQAQHDLNVAQIRLAKALGVDMAAYLGVR